MTEATVLDAITREVITNRTDSVIREMTTITVRTARSAVIHSGRDFSCGLFDRDAQLQAIGTSIPNHIFPMLWQLRRTLDRFVDDVAPGDIFLGNDPHDGGTHLNDVMLFIPVAYRGEVVGFACNRAHWYDVGGMVPGSISGNAREIYQEGLRLPPIRAGRGNEFERNVVDVIRRNVRVPDDAMGDLQAQLASCRVAARRISEMMDRYDCDVVLEAWREQLDSTERRMRRVIRDLPDGTLVHEGYLDNDGIAPERRRLRVKVRVDGEALSVDYSGSAPQSDGPMNVTHALAHGYAFAGVKAALDPKGAINSGCFRPISVEVPDGSCLGAQPPAAGGGMSEVGQVVIITMVALAKVAPEQVSAEEGAASNHQNVIWIGGRRSRGERTIYYDSLSPGGGARADRDGLDFVRSIRSGNYQTPSLEILERLFPILFTKHQFRKDSGGAGQYRGGLGCVREFRVLADAEVSVLGDHAIVPPAGLYAGYRGAPTKWEVLRNGVRITVPEGFRSKGMFEVGTDDVVRHLTPGGGGWGDSLKREIHRVERDVADRKVSLAQAREVYGVVFMEQSTLTVDEAATQETRASLAGRRMHLRLERGTQPMFHDGVRMAWVCALDGGRQEHSETMAELFTPLRPGPLTVMLAVDNTVEAGVIRVDEEAWADLGVTAGADVLVRMVRP